MGLIMRNILRTTQGLAIGAALLMPSAMAGKAAATELTIDLIFWEITREICIVDKATGNKTCQLVTESLN